jgi:hypothetical protein
MPDFGERRLGRLLARARGLPRARDWQRSVVLEPRPSPRVPELVGDGGGLPFSPLALDGPSAPPDPRDLATEALAVFLGPTGASSLDSWRLLSRTDREAVFGNGRPPELRLVALKRDGHRGPWTCVSQSTGLPLRATRDGVRASSWRLDPDYQLQGDDTILRILLTEQTYAGGRRAEGRMLVPDLYEGPDELVLTMYVTPQRGFQTRTPNPETPVRVALPQPVGSRQVIDGAVFEPAGG